MSRRAANGRYTVAEEARADARARTGLTEEQITCFYSRVEAARSHRPSPRAALIAEFRNMIEKRYG